MEMDNGVGTDCGSGVGGWTGWRRAKGENGDNGNKITIKYFF